jgi:hypothetical protein
MEFEDFLEEMWINMKRAGVRSKYDPRTLIYVSMAMMNYPGTLLPSRKKELLPMKLMAQIGRLFRM